MREFTTFKRGDKVTVVTRVDVWLMFGINQHVTADTEYIVDSVRQSTDTAHPYEAHCRRSGCLHELCHPQFLKLKGHKEYVTAYWFDPLVKPSGRLSATE
jgi:hypothetical protein